MHAHRIALTLLSASALLVVGCSNNARPPTEAKQQNITSQTQSTLTQMQNKDSSLKELLDKSVAYVVFPDVGSGGFIAGGAYGRGAVYQNGNQIGWAKIEKASVGALAGGQTYSELIVFHTQDALNRFKNNELTFGADASAVLLKAGASRAVTFKKGIAVFTMPEGGAMINVSIGGQRFVYTPLNANENQNQNANNQNEDQNQNQDQNQNNQ